MSLQFPLPTIQDIQIYEYIGIYRDIYIYIWISRDIPLGFFKHWMFNAWFESTTFFFIHGIFNTWFGKIVKTHFNYYKHVGI